LAGLKRVKGAFTTQFTIKYQKDGERKLQLKACAPPILVTDLPTHLQAKALHAAPIANELSEEVISRLRKAAGILSLDPQGFVRGFDKKGNVYLKQWKGQKVLEQVDVYKSSLNELKALTGTNNLKTAMRIISDYGVNIVIVTKGVQGAMLLFDGTFCSIQAYKSSQVVDPTGAGDAFSGAFLAEYVRRKDVLWCACVGAASASFVVAGVGPKRFGEKEETYERAREIYEKQLKK
jgi:sugar/nucleoside kinase (ribokinase family)